VAASRARRARGAIAKDGNDALSRGGVESIQSTHESVQLEAVDLASKTTNILQLTCSGAL